MRNRQVEYRPENGYIKLIHDEDINGYPDTVTDKTGTIDLEIIKQIKENMQYEPWERYGGAKIIKRDEVSSKDWNKIMHNTKWRL